MLATAGDTPLSDAPGQPDAVLPLPTVTLTATRSGAVFTLRIVSAAYAGKVQIYATPAVSAGRDFFSKSAFRLLEVDGNLAAGGTSIGAAYTAKYGPAALGTKIAVKVVPISANGFKGASYFATAIVSAP